MAAAPGAGRSARLPARFRQPQRFIHIVIRTNFLKSRREK